MSMTMHHRENDKTATELFSYAVIYWTLFGISRYLHIGGPDVSRRLVCLFISFPIMCLYGRAGECRRTCRTSCGSRRTTRHSCSAISSSTSPFSQHPSPRALIRPSRVSKSSAGRVISIRTTRTTIVPRTLLLRRLPDALAVFLLVRLFFPHVQPTVHSDRMDGSVRVSDMVG